MFCWADTGLLLAFRLFLSRYYFAYHSSTNSQAKMYGLECCGWVKKIHTRADMSYTLIVFHCFDCDSIMLACFDSICFTSLGYILCNVILLFYLQQTYLEGLLADGPDSDDDKPLSEIKQSLVLSRFLTPKLESAKVCVMRCWFASWHLCIL